MAEEDAIELKVLPDEAILAESAPPPAAALPPIPVDEFLAIDSSRVTFREYWHDTNPLNALLCCVLKVLRVPIPTSSDDPAVRTLAPFESPLPPEDVQRRLAPAMQLLSSLGFESPIYHVIRDEHQRTRTNLATMRHPSGQAIARVHNRVWGVHTPPKDIVFVEILTRFSDGTFLWTTSGKLDFLAPANCIVQRKHRAVPAVLWQMHQDRLHQLATQRTVLPITDDDSVRQAIEQHHASVRDFHLHRGVFRPLSEIEQSRIIALSSSQAQLQAADQPNADVLVELDKLQRKQTSWKNFVIVLCVSLIAFAAAGRFKFDWEFLLIVIGILFFHELGHYVAMRIFRYRNLKMFFIPLFGAAVSGRKYDAPAWKKVIVFLAGPLPGIYIGILIGLLGMYMHNPMLIQIAQFTVILNGVNLLPMIPLDGGHVANALIFARHRFLETGFRVAAALGLIGVSFLIHDNIIRVLGILMLLGAASAYRIARATSELRKAGVRAEVTPDEMIPMSTAAVIIERLRAGVGRKQSSKLLAQQTVQVFENLAARPPGVGATLGFGALHLFSFAVAAVFGIVLAAGGQLGGFNPNRNFVAKEPSQHRVVLHEIQTWGVAQPEPAIVLAGTFKKSEMAVLFYEKLKATGGQVQLFGNTVLIAFGTEPTNLSDIEKKFEGAGADVVIDRGWSNYLYIECVAPSSEVADAIEAEFHRYSGVLRQAHLLPPWTLENKPADRRAGFDRARETFKTIQASRYELYAEPQLQAINKAWGETFRSNDTTLRNELDKERKRLTRELWLKKIQDMLANPKPEMDVELLKKYVAIEQAGPSPTGQYRFAELAPLMGQLPIKNGEVVPGADRTSVSGSIEADGRTLLINLSCRDLIHGPTAVLQWLTARGCTDFEYQLLPGTPDEATDVDDAFVD